MKPTPQRKIGTIIVPVTTTHQYAFLLISINKNEPFIKIYIESA